MLQGVERRRRRSDSIELALHHWLCKAAKRADLFAIVLADANGGLVGGSLRGAEAKKLAAIAPLIARREREGALPGMSVEETQKVPVVVEKIPVGDVPHFLCAVGGAGANDDALLDASVGVHRILSA